MLTIRTHQLQTLTQRQWEQFIDEMVCHLFSYFPSVAWLLTADELRHRVNATIARAEAYQLRSQQQVCRFINLAATYGWEFDSDPDLVWMRAMLTDAGLAMPGERLDRLVQSCLHRQHIEEKNRALYQRLGLASGPARELPRPAAAADYLGNQYATTESTPDANQKLIARNRMGYHLSQCLWHSGEGVEEQRTPAEPHAWVDNVPPLLRHQ